MLLWNGTDGSGTENGDGWEDMIMTTVSQVVETLLFLNNPEPK